jgi:hypothetical protein
MGILSDFFIADKSPVPEYNGGEGFDDADKYQCRWITPLQCGQFLAVLRKKKYTVKMIGEFKLLTPEESDNWTMSVPQDFVDALAKLKEKEIPALAGKFAKATTEELGWSADDFVPVIRSLSALAKRAVKQKKAMFHWNCL